MCPEDLGDRVPSSIKGIARERLLDSFPGMRIHHVSGTAGVEARSPSGLARSQMKHTMRVEHPPNPVSPSGSTVPAPRKSCVMGRGDGKARKKFGT